MAKKQLKYFITDTCGDCIQVPYSKERFMQLLKNDIEAYIDVCDKETIAWKFNDFMNNLINDNAFALDINGYLFQVVYRTPDFQNPRWWDNELTRERALNDLKKNKGETNVNTLYRMFLLDARARNMLLRNKVAHVKDLLLLDEENLMKLRGCGRGSVQLIISTINEVKEILKEE